MDLVVVYRSNVSCGIEHHEWEVGAGELVSGAEEGEVQKGLQREYRGEVLEHNVSVIGQAGKGGVG